jgi:hypothetical protein
MCREPVIVARALRLLLGVPASWVSMLCDLADARHTAVRLPRYALGNKGLRWLSTFVSHCCCDIDLEVGRVRCSLCNAKCAGAAM